MELDCSNLVTARTSLATILGISTSELETRIHSFNYESTSEEEKGNFPFRDLLLMKACGPLDKLPKASSALWFHATRVPKGTHFQEGLLTTREMRSRIMGTLRDLAVERGLCSPDEWTELLRVSGSTANKTGKLISSRDRGVDAGPHGFLCRDWIVEHGQYYLQISEFGREMCGRLGAIGERLVAEYEQATRPTIVKFRARESVIIDAAVEYVYWMLTDGELPIECSCGFDGVGVAIPAEDVLSVEHI